MRRWVTSFGLLTLCGCMTSDGLNTLNMSETNVSNLSRVSTGMDEQEVGSIMHQPYSKETIQLKDGHTYEVWFYVTSPTIMGQTSMVHYNLTPLTFKDDHLVSIGWDYYRSVKDEQKMEATQPAASPTPQPAPPEPPAPPTPAQQEQSEEVEKALEPEPTNEESPPPPAKEEQTPQEKSDLEKTLNEPKTEESSPPSKPSSETSKLSWRGGYLFLAAGDAPESEEKEKDEPKKKSGESCPTQNGESEKDEQMIDQGRDQEFHFW